MDFQPAPHLNFSIKSKLLQPQFLLPLVQIGLLAGISGGWIRLGSLLIPLPSAAANHGLLMVGGFLGTLISVERAMVMSQKTWLLILLVYLTCLELVSEDSA